MRTRKIVIDKADRLYQLPPDTPAYLYSERRRLSSQRIPTIDLSTLIWPIQFGSGHISQELLVPASERDIAGLREDIASWMHLTHGAKLDPETEIFIGGSVSQLLYVVAVAFVDSGDLVFAPSLGTPLYRRVASAVGGEILRYDISSKNNWLPTFDRVTSRAGRVARVLFLNSPHNPSGSECDARVMSDLVWLAGKENIVIVNDASFAALSAHRPPSLMSVSGGKHAGIELYSTARTFGTATMPLGFAVGNKDAIAGLQAAAKVVPPVVQSWMIAMTREAMHSRSDNLEPIKKRMAHSRAAALSLCEALSLEPAGYQSIPFLWAKIEGRRASSALASLLFRRSRILVTPGIAFGDAGEGYVQFSLTADPDAYTFAKERIQKKLSILKLVERQ